MTLLEHPSPLLQWGTVLGASLVAAIWDLRSRRIPNRLTGPLLLFGLVSAVWIGGSVGLLESLAAMFVLALPFVLLFALAGGGAGDAKLMGAIGACLGLQQGIAVLGAVAVSGIGMALVWALRRGQLVPVTREVATVARAAMLPLFGAAGFDDLRAAMPDHEHSEKMPYGIAIFAGVALAAGGVQWLRSA